MILILFLVLLLSSLAPKNHLGSILNEEFLVSAPPSLTTPMSFQDIINDVSIQSPDMKQDIKVIHEKGFSCFYLNSAKKTFSKEIGGSALFSESALLIIKYGLKEGRTAENIVSLINKGFQRYKISHLTDIKLNQYCEINQMWHVILREKIFVIVDRWIQTCSSKEQAEYQQRFDQVKSEFKEKNTVDLTKKTLREMFFFKPILSNRDKSCSELIFLGEYLNVVESNVLSLFNEEGLGGESLNNLKYTALALLSYYNAINEVELEKEVLTTLTKKGHHLLVEKLIVLVRGMISMGHLHLKKLYLEDVLKGKQSEEDSHGIVTYQEKNFYLVEKPFVEVRYVYKYPLHLRSIEFFELISNKFYFPDQPMFNQKKRRAERFREQLDHWKQDKKELFVKNFLKKLIPQIQKIHQNKGYHMDLYTKNILIDFDDENLTEVTSVEIFDCETLRGVVEGAEGYYLDAVGMIEAMLIVCQPEFFIELSNHKPSEETNLLPIPHRFLEAFLSGFPIQKMLQDSALIRFFEHLKYLIYNKRMNQEDLKTLLSLLEDKNDLPDTIKEESEHKKLEEHQGFFKLEPEVDKKKYLFKYTQTDKDDLYKSLNYAVTLKRDEHLPIRWNDVWEYDRSFLKERRKYVTINPLRSVSSLQYSQVDSLNFAFGMIPQVYSVQKGWEYQTQTMTLNNPIEVLYVLLQTVESLNERELMYMSSVISSNCTVKSLDIRYIMKNRYGYQYNLYLVAEWLVALYSPSHLAQMRLCQVEQTIEKYYETVLDKLKDIIQTLSNNKEDDSFNKVSFSKEMLQYANQLIVILEKKEKVEDRLITIEKISQLKREVMSQVSQIKQTRNNYVTLKKKTSDELRDIFQLQLAKDKIKWEELCEKVQVKEGEEMYFDEFTKSFVLNRNTCLWGRLDAGVIQPIIDSLIPDKENIISFINCLIMAVYIKHKYRLWKDQICINEQADLWEPMKPSNLDSLLGSILEGLKLNNQKMTDLIIQISHLEASILIKIYLFELSRSKEITQAVKNVLPRNYVKIGQGVSGIVIEGNQNDSVYKYIAYRDEEFMETLKEVWRRLQLATDRVPLLYSIEKASNEVIQIKMSRLRGDNLCTLLIKEGATALSEYEWVSFMELTLDYVEVCLQNNIAPIDLELRNVVITKEREFIYFDIDSYILLDGLEEAEKENLVRMQIFPCIWLVIQTVVMQTNPPVPTENWLNLYKNLYIKGESTEPVTKELFDYLRKEFREIKKTCLEGKNQKFPLLEPLKVSQVIESCSSMKSA